MNSFEMLCNYESAIVWLYPKNVSGSVQLRQSTYLRINWIFSICNPSQDFKDYFCLGLLSIPINPGRQNWNDPTFKGSLYWNNCVIQNVNLPRTLKPTSETKQKNPIFRLMLFGINHIWFLKLWILSKRSFTNYVNKILAFFTTYPLCWHFPHYKHWQKVNIWTI